MAWIEGHAWLLVAGFAGVIFLIVILRHAGGFKAKASLPGGSFVLEGMGQITDAGSTPTPRPRGRVQPGVNATGERNVAIGGSVHGGTIITGNRSRVG
jgi:hypothetical protein